MFIQPVLVRTELFDSFAKWLFSSVLYDNNDELQNQYNK